MQAAGLDDWRQLLSTLAARFATKDFATALALVDAIGSAAEEVDHHPDIDLRWGLVAVRLRSHDVNGLTDRDLRLAATISDLAAEHGATPAPHQVMIAEVALDTADASRIITFWRALYAIDADGASDDEVTDPTGQLPTLWFQETEEHPTPRQRFHLDVWVPADRAEERVAAVVAAGGTLVTDEYAPSFWVLADADGNKACVCTVLARHATTD